MASGWSSENINTLNKILMIIYAPQVGIPSDRTLVIITQLLDRIANFILI